MDYAWHQRVDLECRVGNLSRGERDVMRALGRLMAMGDDMPSEARLANEAACSRRTVQRAKVKARALGLLAWERRHQREGGRVRRLPCLYRAERATQPVVKRQKGAGADSERKMLRSVQAQLAALEPITPALEALWAARRARLGSGNLVAIR